ncbi:MAG: hypothetical protein WCS71_05895, partial [Sphaerochaetaceae bacterium]
MKRWILWLCFLLVLTMPDLFATKQAVVDTVIIAGPDECTLVIPPDYPEYTYSYSCTGTWHTEGELDEEKEEEEPGFEVEYSWSAGGCEIIGSNIGTVVTVKFRAGNSSNASLMCMYSVVCKSGAGDGDNKLAFKTIYLPVWDPGSPISAHLEGTSMSPNSRRSIPINGTLTVTVSLGSSGELDRRESITVTTPLDSIVHTGGGSSGGGEYSIAAAGEITMTDVGGEGKSAETGSPYWVASTGSFPDGNVGESATWKAPEAPHKGIVIRAMVDDLAQKPENEAGSADDTATEAGEVIVDVVEVASLEPAMGEEIDDEDEDPYTRTFVVAAAETGVVTINATPNPVVAKERLPNEWTLTGGDGDDKLFRTIDRTKPDIYELTCTCGTSEKKTKVIVFKADLEIYKPKVIDSAESMIPDDDELSSGSITFVNLDNDDNDGHFDHGGASADGEVSGGDDELIMVKLKLQPSELSEGKVTLLATAGAGNIAMWANNTKAASEAYQPGTELNVPNDFTVEENSLVKTLWVEGISAHVNPQGTRLKLECTIGSTTCEDEAALTVAGVNQITWEGKNNSLNDNNTLDADPNWPSGLTPGALRVFPGARMESGSVGSARDKVTVKVTLTVSPPQSVKLYLKSIDVDDPTSAVSPVDDENSENDNRGTSPSKAGQFTGESDGVLELVFQKNVKTADCEFQVTMQPGDNFRIVANGDKDFLLQLENKDSTQDVGASDMEKNANKQRICHKYVTGTPAEREIRFPDKYASPVLTLWRFLHIEVDSMVAPPTAGAEKNFVDGNLTGVSGNRKVAQQVGLSVNLRTGLAPQDNSANLTAGADNGRFENGWIGIGAGSGTPTSGLLGNGDDFVRRDEGIDIPALVSKAGQPNVAGKVIAWSGTAFTLNVSSETLSASYNGGTLSVAGVSATITTVGETSIVNVATAPVIPFVLYDDDGAILPRLPFVGAEAQQIFGSAFVRPLADGAGNPAYNSLNVPFARNTPIASLAAVFASANAIQSSANRLQRFWCGYSISAFQFSATPEQVGPIGPGNPPRGDSDPNAEAMIPGLNYSGKGA